jgi:hypothetical protein
MLWANPKTNVAAKNSWKSRGKSNSLFLVRLRIGLALFCYSERGIVQYVPDTGLRRYDNVDNPLFICNP